MLKDRCPYVQAVHDENMQPLRWTDAQRTDFAIRMREARVYAGMSQKEAAAAIGIKQGTLSELEKSATKSAHTAAAARVYKVNPYWLQSGTGQMKPQESAAELSPRAAYLAAELDQIKDSQEFERACAMCEALVSLAKSGQLVAWTLGARPPAPGGSSTAAPPVDQMLRIAGAPPAQT